MQKMIVRFLVLAGSLVLLAILLPGCPVLEEDSCTGIVEGQTYEVELQILDGNVLYAAEVEQEEDGDNDEDGDDDDNDNDDNDNDEADDDTDSEDDGTGEYEITAQVTAIADDLSSFELLGALTVVLEPDAEIDFTIADLAVGAWVEVEGDYENGVFEGDEIGLADEEETEIKGVVLDVTSTSFTMAGLVITYDGQTDIECQDSEDDDDVECEQEGENEGENEGC